MKFHPAVICLIVLAASALSTSIVSADIFETDYGLTPAVVLLPDGDDSSFSAAMGLAERLGAKGILGMPPSMIFGRFPAGTDAIDFGTLEVRFITESRQLDPSETDLVTLKVARGLLDEEKILARSISMPAVPFRDVLLDVPQHIIDETTPRKTPGPRSGSPAEITERAINQNAEFLIGNILINVILPESDGTVQTEDWTDDEIGNVLRDMLLGLSQYEQATHWVPLSFSVNCPDYHRGVSVSLEPILGTMDIDPIWIVEAYKYLAAVYDIDMPDRPDARVAAHLFNTDMRSRYTDEFGNLVFDWVFGVFLCDASETKCWDGGTAEYAAYANLGGPYLVCCYPACDFGTGLNFAHVFDHEMAHIFWAGDEYDIDSATDCTWRGGYLNYRNGNSFKDDCGEGNPCIMNTDPLTEPLPICRFTMGQMGLADDTSITGENGPNSIPDIFEVKPTLTAYTPRSDTTYYGDILITLDIEQIPVPNENTRIPSDIRIDYAPEIKKGEMRINNGFWEPIPGKWTGFSSATKGIILMEGLDPGENSIYLRATNIMNLSGIDSVSVYFVGVRYYEASAMAQPGTIEVTWKTATETFGADFDLFREDLTERSREQLIVQIDGDSFYSADSERKRYRYTDSAVMPGHRYRYRVEGEITDGVTQPLLYESRDMTETAVVPFAGDFVSPIIPNPTDDRGSTFSIEVPRSYYDPSGTNSSREMLRAPAAETKTDVIVDVYDVAGRHVRQVYNLGVFGGQILTLTWDGLDDRGSQVAAGVYFMKVTAGSNKQVQKVVIIR